MKPAYVTVEFWRNSREDTATIEGWLTTDFLETRHVLISPSLDYDETTIKIAIAWDKIISIIPTASVREYQTQVSVMSGDGRVAMVDLVTGAIEEIDIHDVN